MNMPTSMEEANGGTYFDTSGLGMGPKELFLIIGLGLILLGLLTVLFAFATKAKYTFIIFENGIIARSKGKETSLLFTEIEDVYLFSVGKYSYSGFMNSLAYRKNKADDWFIISLRHAKSHKLIETFRELHTAQRAASLLPQIKLGNKLKFNYVDSKSVWLKRAFAMKVNDYVKSTSSTKDFYLSKNEIEIDGEKIQISGSDKVNADSWIENVYLLDNAGIKKFALMLPSIISADVFVSILRLSIEELK